MHKLGTLQVQTRFMLLNPELHPNYHLQSDIPGDVLEDVLRDLGARAKGVWNFP